MLAALALALALGVIEQDPPRQPPQDAPIPRRC